MIEFQIFKDHIQKIRYHQAENGEMQNLTEVATYWTIQRSDDLLYEEGQGVDNH